MLGFVQQNHTFLPTDLRSILAFDFSKSQNQVQGVFSKVTLVATEIKIS